MKQLMRKPMTKLILAFALTLPLFAASPTLFDRYEAVRQALLKNSLADVQKNAKALSSAAATAKNEAVAKQAGAVAASTDLTKARASFAALSDEMIKVRSTTKGARPAVYACSMLKKSWLQPKGQAGNPYDPSMAMCGELQAE